MKTILSSSAALLGAVLLSPSAWAQTDSPSQPLTPNSVIYLPQIPTVTELSHTASAKGQAIASIQQMDGVETVVYHTANNQTNVVEYRALPGNGQSAAENDPSPAPAVAPQPASPPQPATGPAPAVVYAAPAPAVYYYDAAPYYYPWGWYPGYVRIGFGGFGYGGARFGGGFRGGWRR